MNYDDKIRKKLKLNKKTVNGCWIWEGGKHGKYGIVKYHNKSSKVHRISYKLFNGYLDPNLTIDHICRNTLCINPKHLRQITRKENASLANAQRKKQKCIRGHEFTKENTRINKKTGKRECKFCKNIRKQKIIINNLKLSDIEKLKHRIKNKIKKI